VVVNLLSKSAHFGAHPVNFTASKLAELFVSMVVRRKGFPLSMMTDWDPIFTSFFFGANILNQVA
jgi:hypothetical protein